MKKWVAGSAFLLLFLPVSGQEILNRIISVNIHGEPLPRALQEISKKGNFYFSYQSTYIAEDYRVSCVASNKTVREVLDVLLDLKFRYQQVANYVILKPAAKVVATGNRDTPLTKFYTIEGYIQEAGGNKLADASVIEKSELAGCLSAQDGFFKLKLKTSNKATAITVSKAGYEDTTVVLSRTIRSLTISLSREWFADSAIIIRPDQSAVAGSTDEHAATELLRSFPLALFVDTLKPSKTRLGNVLISTGQKIQTLNLRNFFTSRLMQFSLVPGVSTEGNLSSQVTNKFSFNVLGGYTGGVNGFEFGGLFNINQNAVKYAQVAGLINISGGNVQGLQLAGANNTVLKSLTGVQLAGVSNYVQKKLNGLQLAGIYNHVSDSVNGVQISLISNYSRKTLTGLQVTGLFNFSNQETRGGQVGLFNYSKKLTGIQLGLINVADTSNGYSIGLFNIILKGYHKLVLSASEFEQLNLAFKTGTNKLYSILSFGASGYQQEKVFTAGYGLGREFSLSNKISLNTEAVSHWVYLGNIFDFNLLTKISADLHLKFGKHFSLFAGPSFNAFYSKHYLPMPGYKPDLPREGYHMFQFSNGWPGWIGWTAGVSLF